MGPLAVVIGPFFFTMVAPAGQTGAGCWAVLRAVERRNRGPWTAGPGQLVPGIGPRAVDISPGPFRYRVIFRGFWAQNRDFFAAAGARAGGVMYHVSRKYLPVI